MSFQMKVDKDAAMSAELHCDARIQSTTVGGSKPLHYFMKGQPKITGSALLVLGCSFFIICVTVVRESSHHMWTVFPPGVLLGIMFIICGILYIVTEYNTTKKTVTISLALTIVTILGIFWTILQIILNIHFRHHDYTIHDIYDNVTETAMQWSEYHEAMAVSIEVVYLCYCLMCVVVFIVMSVLAGAALRSTKSQAIVVMTTAPIEMPVE
ncbi:uncharacterized protein si:ch1073-291c23.2 isoform X1 [Takifugu flavidus]|nr:uncharacterized protein si:ch1073-291c23.2 isoform X1 [Takifugu flavidus]